jgi:hypothetical protein
MISLLAPSSRLGPTREINQINSKDLFDTDCYPPSLLKIDRLSIHPGDFINLSQKSLSNELTKVQTKVTYSLGCFLGLILPVSLPFLIGTDDTQLNHFGSVVFIPPGSGHLQPLLNDIAVSAFHGSRADG